MLNTLFVTMMYGYAIPMLFPIAAFSFINQLIFEKILIIYYYQKPPVYDDRLNKVVLSLMKYAALFMLFFGYWCLGNMQIYNNVTNPRTYFNLPIVTGHKIRPNLGVELPLLIVGILVILIFIFKRAFNDCLIKCGGV